MTEQLISMDVYITHNALEAEEHVQALARVQAVASARAIFEANGWRDLRKLREGGIWECSDTESTCGYRVDARSVPHCHVTVTGFGAKAVV